MKPKPAFCLSQSLDLAMLPLRPNCHNACMTIDERLERLTERHEALTQSVEMMALENKEQDRRLVEVTEDISKLTTRQAEIMEGWPASSMSRRSTSTVSSGWKTRANRFR
jgi:ATPase subunit of ABC transporter with duplicated ATPase domains